MDRYDGRPDSEPDGRGFGKPYYLDEKTFLGAGAMVRSIIDPTTGRGLVVLDLIGIWHGKPDEDATFSIVLHRDVADELSRYTADAVSSAGEDEAVWRLNHPQ